MPLLIERTVRNKLYKLAPRACLASQISDPSPANLAPEKSLKTCLFVLFLRGWGEGGATQSFIDKNMTHVSLSVSTRKKVFLLYKYL